MLSEPTVQVGTQIVGSDGNPAGWVKDVRASDVLVDRSMERDVLIPKDALHDENGRVTVDVPAAEVNEQGWPEPPVA